MARLSWLHLSDLHLGIHGSNLLQSEYRELLEQDLRKLHVQTGPWELVLISGDLTLTGSVREFQLLDSALGSLWKLFRDLGSQPCLLSVPGNHDIWRPFPSASDVGADVGARYRALDARKAFRTTRQTEAGRAIWKGFTPFNNWLSTWRHTHPTPKLQTFGKGLLPGDFAATLALEDLRVGVIGLNSNFRSSAKDGLDGVTEVDVEQVERATGPETGKWASDHDVLLMLTHHPPSMLRGDLLAELGERLATPGRPLLHLCGGRHTEERGPIGVPLRPWSLSIHANALFSELPSGSPEQRWGYIAGQIDLTSHGGRLALYPRSASWRDGEFVLGPDARAVSDARGVLEIPLSELLRQPSAAATPSAPEASTSTPALCLPPPSGAPPLETPRQEKRRSGPSVDTPIRILHLSDLHVGAEDDPLSLLQPLTADLRGELKVDRLDHLVISGDISQRASPEEFQKAQQFISKLMEQFGLSAQSCVIVPGNHDLDWGVQAYTWKKKRLVGDMSKLTSGSFYDEGEHCFIRDEGRYPERFKNFSEHFYQPLLQKPYPLDSQEQCLSFLFSESRLQFLAMNSAFAIDDHFRDRASISEEALSRGLLSADQELAQAQARGDFEREGQILRIAVWHHPITGNEKIKDDAFVGRLLQANVRLCLHGHIHEARADLINYIHPVRRIHVMGAGSFGAPTHDRPESVPRSYNLMEVDRDLRKIRVKFRALRRKGGAWGPWALWPAETSDELRAYYDLTLSPS